MVITSFLCLIIAFMLSFLSASRRKYAKIINKFEGPPTVPIFGNALLFLCRPHEARVKNMMKLVDTYQKSFRIWFLQKPYIVIITPQDFEIVSRKVVCKGAELNSLKLIYGDGLLLSDDEKWKIRRRLLCPAFNANIFSINFVEVFNRKNYDLVRKLEKNCGTEKPFDLWPEILRCDIEKFVETIYGYDTTDDQKLIDRLEEHLMRLDKEQQKVYSQPWLQSPLLYRLYSYFTGLEELSSTMFRFAKKILSTTKSNLEQLGYNETENLEKLPPSFMNILLKNPKVYSKANTENEIVSMFGGAAEIPVLNCFTLLMLAIHQDIQQKVYEEIFEVFGESTRPPRIEDLAKLTYLEQCIKETLRRYPVVPNVARYVNEDLQIGDNQIIPKGTSVLLSILGVHLNKTIYPDPLTWNPDNFSPENVSQRSRNSFVPFSSGLRKCPGDKYSYLSSKAVISTLLRHFKFSSDTKAENLQINLYTFVGSRDGYHVKLTYRHDKLFF